MIQLSSNPTTNRLDLVIRDLTDDELAGLPARIAAESQKLQPGWTAAVDLRGVSALPQDKTPLIVDTQVAIVKGGARKIGTLVDSAVLKSQLNRMAAAAGSGDATQRFEDPAQLDAFLAS